MSEFPSLRLTVPSYIEREFRKIAKAHFPYESYGLLLGTMAGDSIVVDELYVPEDMESHSGRSSMEVPDHWIVDAGEVASESSLIVVGDIHSHCYEYEEYLTIIRDRSQSETDLDYPSKLAIAGICVVQQMKRKGEMYLRSSFRFWGPQIPVVVNSG